MSSAVEAFSRFFGWRTVDDPDDCHSFQLINGDGLFNSQGLMEFVREVELSECGRSYAIVAIMGPQSSGKSTLVNTLFHTNFKEMSNSEGRSQTTQGIWLARGLNMNPLTLVMDIEGTDGTERGEDDTTFEKQSALFALAVADVVLINMWCHDIGREHAANKPLLRAVFQQVLIRFCDEPRIITLMFVVRDKTLSPEDKLEAQLKKDLEKIWASIPKPPASTNTQLTSVFKVKVEFLPNYESNQRDFKSKVKTLKQQFIGSSAPGDLVEDGKEPASGFANLAENIWKDIMENKDLNLPAHQVMVANIRCEEIRDEKYGSFEINESWYTLRKDAQLNFIPEFGEKVDSLINACVSQYDKEVYYFDEKVRTKWREDLENNLLKLVEPAYRAMLNHLKLKHLKKFMEECDRYSDEEKLPSTVDALVNSRLHEFDMECEDVSIVRANWDSLKERAKLQLDMNSYVAVKRDDRLASRIRRVLEPKLKQELSDSVKLLLCEETDPTWSKIRERFKSVLESNLPELVGTLIEFGVDEEGQKEKLDSMKKYAKDVVEAKAREESGRAKEHMLNKFVKLFKYDYDSSPDWTSNEDIEAAANNALYSPLNVLAGLAAIRLEDDEADYNIHRILSSALFSSADPKTRNPLHRPLNSGEPYTLNDLASTAWEKVPPSRTLITPTQCKQLMQEFLVEARVLLTQAIEAFKKKQKKKPKWKRIMRSIWNTLKAVSVIFGVTTGFDDIFFD